MSMRTGDFYRSRFTKPKDLNGPTHAEVSHVASETFKDSSEPKPLVYFKGMRKPLVLNKTNTQALEDIAGTDLMDDWPGVKCVLVPTTTQVNGEQKPTIRVEAPSQAELPTRRPIKANAGDGMDDEIPF
jgi:hypothetical protein